MICIYLLTDSIHFFSFSVRVRKIGAESNRKYNIMNLKNKVDVAKWKSIKMMREDNKKVFKANRNDEEPKFGAGSEFGKDAKEEARRKKFGIISKVSSVAIEAIVDCKGEVNGYL